MTNSDRFRESSALSLTSDQQKERVVIGEVLGKAPLTQAELAGMSYAEQISH